MAAAPPCAALHLIVLVDCRSQDEVLFDSLRSEVANQCLNILHIFRITQCRLTTPLLMTVKCAHTKRVDTLIEEEKSFELMERALHHLLCDMKPSVPPPSCNSAPLSARMVPLKRALASLSRDVLSLPHNYRCQRRVLLTTSYLSYSDLFTSLTAMQQALQFHEADEYLHVVAVDDKAVCVTTANLGSSPSYEASCPSHQRLYRSSPSIPDIRFALQTSLTRFLLPDASSHVTVQVVLGGEGLDVCARARRPYIEEVRRCCLPDDFSSRSDANSVFGSTGVVFCGTTARPSLLQRSLTPPAVETVPPVMLFLEAVLSPSLVDEAFLYGDPWLLSPSCAAQGSVWRQLYQVFSRDVLLLRSNSPELQSKHHIALCQSCYVAFFRGPQHIVLRQVIPSELRRELNENERASDGLRSTPQDQAVHDQFTALRQQFLQSSLQMRELLSGGLGAVSGQLFSEPAAGHIVFQKHEGG